MARATVGISNVELGYEDDGIEVNIGPYDEDGELSQTKAYQYTVEVLAEGIINLYSDDGYYSFKITDLIASGKILNQLQAS